MGVIAYPAWHRGFVISHGCKATPYEPASSHNDLLDRAPPCDVGHSTNLALYRQPADPGLGRGMVGDVVRGGADQGPRRPAALGFLHGAWRSARLVCAARSLHGPT